MKTQIEALRTNVLKLANRGSEQLDALGDGRRRKALLVELGQITFDEESGNPADAANRARVLAELTRIAEDNDDSDSSDSDDNDDSAPSVDNGEA